jgi:predicted RNA-binding Zn ribbon-like protein
MNKSLSNEIDTAAGQFQTLGEHPALNLLNTVTRKDGKLVDSLKNGNDVLRWLDCAGWPLTQGSRPSIPPGMLKAAHRLREEVRTLIEKRKAGKRVNFENLNAFLASAESHVQIEICQDRKFDLHRIWRERTAEQVLGPLAEAAAELLIEGDFSLIRRCENKDCGFWFYDLTRSHRRRWCSMSTCGNRGKVKAFRTREWHKSLTGRPRKPMRTKPAK